MPDTLETLMRSHDGPFSRVEWAAARWGRGAWPRLARGADAALLEARLQDCVAALARLRRACGSAISDAAERLVGRVARYRRAAVSALR